MGKGLIPREFINQLIASSDIVDIIGRIIPLKKRGINFTACCPFHDEKTPSFYVSPQKQIYHCFGCGAGGNVISFLKDYENLSFVDTIEELASICGLSIPYSTDNNQKTSNTDDQKQTLLYEIMDKANKLFRWQLKHHKDAKKVVEYIKSRGISAETAQAFALGFAPNQWQILFDTLSEKYNPELLMDAGVIVQNQSNRYYDKFRNRLIFPIRSRQGKIIAFGGRALDQEQKPKYLNSPETAIFHKSNEIYGLYEIRRQRIQLDYLLVTEGYLDVISLHEHGFNQAVATLGTALTDQHLKRLYRETNCLIFAFDGDNAGIQAAVRALHLVLPMLNEQRQAKFLTLPSHDDPDSYIRAHGLNQFNQQVEKAIPALEFAIQQLTGNTPETDADSRARIIEQAIILLGKMDITYQIVFKQTLAERFNLTPKQLDQAILYQKKQPLPSRSSQNQSNNFKRPLLDKPLKLKKERLTLEEKAMALILQKPNAIKNITLPEKNDIQQPNDCNLLLDLAYNASQIPYTALLLEHMSEQHPNQKQYLYAISAIDFPLLDEKEIQTELNATFIKLKQKNDDIMLNKLIEKSKHSQLNIKEKQLLKQLLTRH